MKPSLLLGDAGKKKPGPSYRGGGRMRIELGQGDLERLGTQEEAVQVSTGLRAHIATTHQGMKMQRIFQRGRFESTQAKGHQRCRRAEGGRRTISVRSKCWTI
jgi:hypothetical protein